MNSLIRNTKLNMNIIKIIDDYVGITTEFLIKIEKEQFQKINKIHTIMLWDTCNSLFIGLFSTKDLALKYLIRYLINYHISLNHNLSKKDFNTQVFQKIKDYEFIICDHINPNMPIYFILNKRHNHIPQNYFTNDEILAKKDSGNKLYNIIIDPISLNLNLPL